MKRDRFLELKELFLALREEPRDARWERLGEIRRRDVAMSEDLARLLELDDVPDDALDVPALGDAFRVPEVEALAREEEPDRCGWRVGNYRLMSEIGRGGMGVVYLAEQDEPRRAIALKLLRSIDPGPAALERFRRESHALGRLQHPGVAQIFEAGTADTPEGRQPFLAMELVDGRPLFEWAEAKRADLRERVGLLVEICTAVHHAHERGVLHCDLKPENVLATQDGRPKVIDFGVAQVMRAVDEADEPRRQAGTLPYMAPELRPRSPSTPDRRADVFSMGLVMVRLLWGPGERCLEAAPLERDLELTALADDPRGELAAIASKASRVERGRRYGTMLELADDLERFLSVRPVHALGGGPVYRAGRLLRRRRYVAVSLVAVALIVAVAFALLVRFGDEAREARAVAERESQRTARVVEFVGRVLGSADPAGGPAGAGPSGTLADLLERAGSYVDATFQDDPDLEATVRVTLAAIHRRNGSLALAESESREALRLARRSLGDEHPATLEAMNTLAGVTLALGRTREAEELLRDLLARTEHADAGLAKVGLGIDGFEEWRGERSPRRMLAQALLEAGRLGEAESALRQYVQGASSGDEDDPSVLLARAELEQLADESGGGAEVEDLLRSAVECATRIFGSEHPETLAARNELGHHVVQIHGRHAEGRAMLEAAHAAAGRVLGTEHPDTLSLRHNLACAHAVHGEWAEAVEATRGVLETRSRVLGDAHVDTLLTANNLAQFEFRLGARDVALARASRVVAAAGDGLPRDHWYRGVFGATYGEMLRLDLRLFEAEKVLRRATMDLERSLARQAAGFLTASRLRGLWQNARNQLGLVLLDMDEYDAARAVLESVYEARVAALGTSHPSTLTSAHNLGSVLRHRGEHERAIGMLRDVLESRIELFGERSPSALRTRLALSSALSSAGDRGAAIAEARELLDLALTHSDPLPEMARFQVHLGSLLADAMELEESEAHCRDALETHRAMFGDEHPGRGHVLAGLGSTLYARKNYAEASEVLREALEVGRVVLGPDHVEVVQLENNLAAALVEIGEREEAGELFVRGLERRERRFGADHPRTLVARNNYAYWLGEGGELEQALEIQEAITARAHAVLGSEDSRTWLYQGSCGRYLNKLGRYDEARQVLEPAVAELVRDYGSPDKVPGPSVGILRDLHVRAGLDPDLVLDELLERTGAE